MEYISMLNVYLLMKVYIVEKDHYSFDSYLFASILDVVHLIEPVDWANSSTELLNDGENIVEENICETVVEEIILEQENENYLTGLDGNCMENSIVYLFEDPVADYSLGEPEFVIEESLTYDLETLEENVESEMMHQADDTMDSNSSQETTGNKSETSQTEENDNVNIVVVQETSVENSVNNFVNSTSDSDSVKSTSLRDHNVNSEFKNDSEVSVIECLPNPEPDPESSSQSFEMKDDFELKLGEFQSPKSNRCFTSKGFDSPLSVNSLKTQDLQLPSTLKDVNKASPCSEKNLSSSQTDLENSPATSGSSAKASSVLGKDQIKKRLQSFSLMKQGIQPVPIKKIINKSPKIQVQLQSDTYDELGNKIDEKLVIIKKPPKQGPTPQERARAVIDEIEQIKREEQLIYEENLSFISNSMREAIKKTKKPINEIEIKNFEKEKPFERKPRRYRNRRSLDKDRKRNKSREVSSEKSRDSFKEDDRKIKEKEKEREKEKEKEKEKEPPRTWGEVKHKNMSIEEICALKEKMFKAHEKNFKKGFKNFEEDEKIYPFRKDDYIKPQPMFEELSLIRNPLPALGVNGLTKYFPSDVIKFTEKLPIITYCENPSFSFDLNKPRKVIMSENPPERNEIMMKIIEGKTEKLNSDISATSSTTRNWYPKTDYFNEPKPKPIICTNVKTNALLVLSEMYDDEEEVIESDKEKHKKHKEKSEKKSKLKKKKLKKKKRKLKSKSKSRSISKEKHKSKHEDKNDKKSKHKDKEKHSKSEEKNVPMESSKKVTKENKTNISDDTKNNDVQSKPKVVENVCKKPNIIERFKEDTPNTDEYRSNWESDLDMDILAENPFAKNRSNSTDKNWESEEERRAQFENRRKTINTDDKRKSRHSRSLSSERINRKQQDILKRNYKSSYLLDLELEEKNKHEKHDTGKRSTKDERNVSLERDKKSSRTRNDSSEKHQHITENKKTSEERSVDNAKKSEERNNERKRSKDIKLDETEVDKKQIVDKPETKEMKHKSRHSEEKSHGSHRSDRSQSKDNKNENDNKTRKSHEDTKKSSESISKDQDHKSLKDAREKSKNIPEIDSQNIRSKEKTEDYHQIKDNKVVCDDEKITNHILSKDLEDESKNRNERSTDRSDSLNRSRRSDLDKKAVSPEGTPIKDRNIIEEKTDKIDDLKEKIADDEKYLSEMKRINEFNIDIDDKSRLGSSSYNKWSSEEDLHNKRKSSTDKSDVKLNYSRRSQWSDDEDYERKRNINEHLNKVTSKYRWEDDLETQCRNLEAEIQKKKEHLLNYRNIEEFNKVTGKYKKNELKSYRKRDERSRDDSEERFKIREKKNKKKIKDKNKPKITLNYSDFEDSIEAGIAEKNEKKPKDPFSDANEIFTKFKAKIKIDYTDFDLSLNECKEKFEENVQKNTISDQSAAMLATPNSVKKLNFDFSDILNEDKYSGNNIVQTQLNTQDEPKEINVEEKNEPVIVSDVPNQILDIPLTTIKVDSIIEISPVVPPSVTSISKLDIEPLIPTPDPNKLVSEYEEFMKAVCFDDSKEDASILAQEPAIKTLDTLDVNKIVETEKIKELPQEEEIRDDEDTSSSSSSDFTDSDSDDSSDDNSSASELSEMSDTTVLKTVANIKTEILSDSDNEHLDKRKDKRKRNDISECDFDFDKITVKNEIDNVHKKAKICNAAFDRNLIEWESSLTSKTLSCDKIFNPVHQSEIDVFDIAPSTVLPENIPLPQDNIMPFITTPSLNEYMYNQSPKLDTISISSESTPSPVKRSQSTIPIKTVETRKPQVDQLTWNSAPEQYEYTPTNYYHHEDKSLYQIVSSSDTSNTESVVNTVSEILEESPNVRKRQSHWNLNLTPVKKPLLIQNSAPEFNQEDSDEDFTDKFVKSPEKKVEKPLPPTPMIHKIDTSNENIESKKTKEPIKSKGSEKEKSDKVKISSESSEKPEVKSDKSRKSSSEKDKKDRKETDHKHDKSRDRASEKSRERSTEKTSKDRDRSIERTNKDRDRDQKEHQRDRDKRRSDLKLDRRLSDRKSSYSKGNRSRYSRDRSPIRSRSSGQERSRERSKDRGRIDRRDLRETRDRSRTNYRRDKYSRSPSPIRTNLKQEIRSVNHPLPQIRPDDTDFSMHSMELAHSPINSPLDGFKRSLADSTISDSELLTQQITPDESEQSPGYSQLPKPYYHQTKELPIQRLESPSSPKRISLDDRINLVLGIEKEPPKSIDTVCSRGPFTNTVPNYHHHDPYAYARHEYEVYSAQTAEQYPPGPYHQYPQPYYQNPMPMENNVKVVQVGNVIQVVPTDQPIVPVSAPPAPTPIAPIAPVAPVAPVGVAAPKINEMPPKVVQVGNMLQIVPMATMETTTTDTSPLAAAAPSTPIPDPVAVPKPIDQLVLERRAEKEKRRLEREQRRLEKEKKRKEKEKRRQLKIKLKTENMIKKALLLETGESELDISNVEPEVETEATDLPVSWPPSTSTILSLPLPRPPSKGILISQGFREKDDSLEESEVRKVVKFADGICPGEGTSPSGGEELPSPPPPPRKLPKEKRYKKVKLNKGKNKKKVKVKIIRTQPPSDSSDTEDNLPPPPPPPGSPPPHLWPPRIKQPPVNNIHPQLNIPVSNTPIYPPPGAAYAPPPQMAYSGGYPPPVVMGQPSMPLLPGPGRSHHPPVIPVLQPGAPGSLSSHHGTHAHHGAPSYH